MARKSQRKKLKEKTVIFCEGETEKYYFDMLKRKYSSIPVSINSIDTKVINGQSLTLVKKAIRMIESEKNKYNYTKKYVVYDKDDEKSNDIHEAIKLANKNGITTLYSNECFEYWILLHYKKKHGYLNRNELYKELEKELGVESYKELKGELIANLLTDKISSAHDNATTLAVEENISEKVDSNPYTNIHYHIKDIFGVTKL